MHRYFFTPLLLSALALARPQTPADTDALSGLPACARDAAISALGSTGCAANDTACICSSQAFIAAITSTVTQTCTPQDVQAALVFAQTYCGDALSGGSETPSAPASAAPTASPSGTDEGGDGGDSYGASTTTVPGTITATTTIPGATNNAAATVSTIPDASMTSMIHSEPTMMTTHCTTTTTIMTTAAKTGPFNSTFTGAAFKNVGQGMMAAAIGVAGAVALL